jgi:hypothetical protein
MICMQRSAGAHVGASCVYLVCVRAPARCSAAARGVRARTVRARAWSFGPRSAAGFISAF